MQGNNRFEGIALVVLTVVLVSVFILSVNMYDSIENNTNSGMIAAFADDVRSLVDSNKAVAAFLGIEDCESQSEDGEEFDVEAAALAYIERYNGIYESAK